MHIQCTSRLVITFNESAENEKDDELVVYWVNFKFISVMFPMALEEVFYMVGNICQSSFQYFKR